MARRRFGTGSIYPEEGRGWAASVSLGKDENGRRVRKLIRGKTRADVEAKLAELLDLLSPPNRCNAFEIEGDLAKIVCVDSRGQIVAVLLDVADVPKVQAHGHKWTARWRDDARRHQVAARTGKSVHAAGSDRIPLGRFLLDAPPDFEIDFINGDTLDHRRVNLRLVTHTQNLVNQTRNRRNKTGVVGVTLRPDGRFQAKACRINLGNFERLDEAARAVQQKRQELFDLFGS